MRKRNFEYNLYQITKINVEKQIFSGTIARMINAFSSSRNGSNTFLWLVHTDNSMQSTYDDEVVTNIIDEENMTDQFFNFDY